MDSLPSFIVHALQLPPTLKYAAITIISLFEGPIVFTIAGFFLRLHTEFLLPVFIILGNFIGDTLWYCIGRFYAGKAIRKNGSLLGISAAHLRSAERVFEKYQGRILFLTKATLGFGTSIGIPAILMAAGMSKVPFRKYFIYNAVGEAVLLVAFMSTGYLFGISYQAVSEDMRRIMLCAIILVFIGGITFARRYLAKQKSV